jgi:hypothetical protein
VTEILANLAGKEERCPVRGSASSTHLAAAEVELACAILLDGSGTIPEKETWLINLIIIGTYL